MTTVTVNVYNYPGDELLESDVALTDVCFDIDVGLALYALNTHGMYLAQPAKNYSVPPRSSYVLLVLSDDDNDAEYLREQARSAELARRGAANW